MTLIWLIYWKNLNYNNSGNPIDPFGEEMTQERETYGIDIAGLHRELELFQIKPGLRIAI